MKSNRAYAESMAAEIHEFFGSDNWEAVLLVSTNKEFKAWEIRMVADIIERHLVRMEQERCKG